MFLALSILSGCASQNKEKHYSGYNLYLKCDIYRNALNGSVIQDCKRGIY
jgi:hypothetical protein